MEVHNNGGGRCKWVANSYAQQESSSTQVGCHASSAALHAQSLCNCLQHNQDLECRSAGDPLGWVFPPPLQHLKAKLSSVPYRHFWRFNSLPQCTAPHVMSNHWCPAAIAMEMCICYVGPMSDLGLCYARSCLSWACLQQKQADQEGNH